MALEEDDRVRLLEYIRQRTCEEHRQGLPCIDRKDKGLVNGTHPACQEADELIELVRGI